MRARQIVIRWRPRSAGGELRELELWGLRPDDQAKGQLARSAARRSAARRRDFPAEPTRCASPRWASAATEPRRSKLRLGTIRGCSRRAFLVYELEGLAHFSGALRQ